MDTTTATTPADKIREGYEAFARGDLAAAMTWIGPDCRWEGASSLLPACGTAAGPEELLSELVTIPESYDVFAPEPEEIHEFDHGRGVLVIGRMRLRPKGAAEESVASYVHVYRFGDDGKATSSVFRTDSAVFAAAMDARGG